MNPPIFVLGTQRSGTTLLCRMLSAHPDIFIQNELNVRQMFRPGWDKDDILKSITDLIEEDHGKSLDSLLQESGKRTWGLKDPELTNHLGDLEKFLPESRFIMILRDGRAVTNSYMENKWGLGTNPYTGSQRWMQEVKMQLEFKEKHDKNVHVLRYEDLITCPEKELRSLFGFLGVDYHEDVLNYNSMPSFYHKTRENKNTYKGLDARLAEKWQKKLTARQIAIIESVAGPLLTRLGYQVSDSHVIPGGIEKLYYRLHQKIIGEIQIQYRWRMSMIREYFRKRALKRS